MAENSEAEPASKAKKSASVGKSGTKRGKGKPFPKGKSGNPGGRPKAVVDVVNLAREHTEDAIRALADVIRSADTDKARIAAANIILERGWGKATQPIANDSDKPFEIVIQQLTRPISEK